MELHAVWVAPPLLLLGALWLWRVYRGHTTPTEIDGSADVDARMDASKGVDSSFSPAPRSEQWWLVGERLDTFVLFHHLGERDIRALSTAFYTRVYSDVEDEAFRALFRERATLEQSINRQAAFFVQMWGGPKR